MRKKILLILFTFVVVFVCFLLYLFTQNTEVYLEQNVASEQTLFKFVDLKESDYFEQSKKYFIETPNIKSDPIETLDKVKKTGDCFSFIDTHNQKSDLNLCGYTPVDPMSEDIVNVKYYNISFLKELGSYLVAENHYEVGILYLVNYKYPYRLNLIFGKPVVSPDKNYFFTIGNEFQGYSDSKGLEVWQIDQSDDINVYKVVSFEPSYFIGNTGIEEAFWVDREIYFKTSVGYGKIIFNSNILDYRE